MTTFKEGKTLKYNLYFLRAKYITTFTDLSLVEYVMLVPFIFLTLVIGVYPSIITDTADPAIFDLCVKLKVI